MTDKCEHKTKLEKNNSIHIPPAQCGRYITSFPPMIRSLFNNIGTQSVQELFFCDSIHRTVYSNDLVKFFWLRCTARKKLGIYDVHTCTMLHR